MPHNAKQAKDERQCKEYIASFIFFELFRQIIVVAYEYFVNERHSCYPVAMFCLSIALDVILTTYKVPHEISPVHEVYLVVYEEPYIIPLCRHLDVWYSCECCILGTHGVCYWLAHPLLILLCMVAAVHTWEEHVLHVVVLLVIAYNLISVRLVGILFLDT